MTVIKATLMILAVIIGLAFDGALMLAVRGAGRPLQVFVALYVLIWVAFAILVLFFSWWGPCGGQFCVKL